MVKLNKQSQRTLLFIGFYLLAGGCNLLVRTRVTLLDSLMFSLNFAIYAGMILFWMQSVRIRLLPSHARRYILLAAGLMLGALLLRVFKYRVVAGAIIASRYATYAYWLYTILIPTLFLMSALCIRWGEKKDGGRKELWLLVPALALCLLALTNDLHSLVYIPKIELASFDIKNGLYVYGLGFYLLNAWMGLMALSGIVILLRLTRKRARGVIAYVLLVLAVWLGLELLNILVIERYALRKIYTTPEIRVFGMLALLEICIRNRLIPHNENYVGFFEKLTLPVLITDKKLASVYRSAISLNVAEDELRAALAASRYISEDTRLSSMELGAGYVFWTENESELHKENRRMESANKLLSEENELIRVENELKEKKARLDAEAEVYRRITAAIYPKQKEIDALLATAVPEGDGFFDVLAECCVLNAYSKRKSNLLLLSEERLPRSNRELFLALQESARFLKCCGVEAAAVGEEYTDIPLPLVHELYDTFEAIVEAYLPVLKRMTVSLTADGLRMALEASEAVELPCAALSVERGQEDETTYLTIRGRKKGDEE